MGFEDLPSPNIQCSERGLTPASLTSIVRSQMKNVIAKLELLGVRSSGERVPVTVEIGRPYDIRDGKGADCAGCPVAIHGLHDNLHDIHGEDTLQALTLAVAFVHRLLSDFTAKGGRLLFKDSDEDFHFEAYFREWRT